MQGEATPNYPAAHDNLAALVAFIKDVKACDAWLKKAGETIKRNEALLKTIGKANEIDKLHAEAQENRDLVLTEIDKREQALADDRRAFDEEMKNKRAAFAADQTKKSERTSAMRTEASAALTAAKDLETAATEANESATAEQARATATNKQVTKLRDELKAKRDAAKAALAATD